MEIPVPGKPVFITETGPWLGDLQSDDKAWRNIGVGLGLEVLKLITLGFWHMKYYVVISKCGDILVKFNQTNYTALLVKNTRAAAFIYL